LHIATYKRARILYLCKGKKVSLSLRWPDIGAMAELASTTRTVSDVLRTVPSENAFYFYRGEGAPSGLKASSLQEFLSRIESADPESLEFHSQRHDFENWVRMLGDPTLAKQMQTLASQNLTPEELKSRLVRIVRMRVGKLKKLTHVA
jgi:hypothetical protein